MKSLRLILLSGLMGLSALTAHAQIRIIPRDKLEAVASPGLSKDSSSLSFNTKHIAAKPMKEDDSPEIFTVEMRNVGSEVIRVHRLQTTCSCVSATLGKGTLNPGETASVILRYDPKGHLGSFDHKVFVYTQPGDEPAAVLRLTVEVESSSDLSRLYQVKMGAIALRSRDVSFSRTEKGVEVLNFVNLSGRGLKLECEEMFLPGSISFHTRPAVIESGQEGEMVISYDPSLGETKDHVSLILKNLGVPPSKSTINIRIE